MFDVWGGRLAARRAGVLISTMLMIGLVASGCSKANNASSTATAGGGAGASSSAAAVATGSAVTGNSQSESGQCPTSNTTSFAKTKFLAHTALAFGAFHRYLWKPYQAGTFKSGAHGRTLALIKAGVAAGVVAHEVKLASADVQANPTLCKAIGAPLAQVGDLVSSAFSKLKGGDVTGLTAVNEAINTVTSKASKQGVAIQEDANPSLTGSG